MRKQRYTLDGDDQIRPEFLTPTNALHLIQGLNDAGDPAQLGVGVGGSGNKDFVEGELLMYKAGKFQSCGRTVADLGSSGSLTLPPGTTLVANTTLKRYNVPLPGANSTVTIPHDADVTGRQPYSLRAVLYCTADDSVSGARVGDEFDLGDSFYPNHIGLQTDLTNIYVTLRNSATLQVVSRYTAPKDFTNFTVGNFMLRVYAIYDVPQAASAALGNGGFVLSNYYNVPMDTYVDVPFSGVGSLKGAQVFLVCVADGGSHGYQKNDMIDIAAGLMFPCGNSGGLYWFGAGGNVMLTANTVRVSIKTTHLQAGAWPGKAVVAPRNGGGTGETWFNTAGDFVDLRDELATKWKILVCAHVSAGLGVGGAIIQASSLKPIVLDDVVDFNFAGTPGILVNAQAFLCAAIDTNGYLAGDRVEAATAWSGTGELFGPGPFQVVLSGNTVRVVCRAPKGLSHLGAWDTFLRPKSGAGDGSVTNGVNISSALASGNWKLQVVATFNS